MRLRRAMNLAASMLTLLLIGAIVNMVIAWGAVPWRWSNLTNIDRRTGPVEQLSVWPYPFPESGDQPATGVRLSTFAVDHDEAFTYWGKGADGYRFGLPFRSLAAWTYGWHGPAFHGSRAIAADWRGAYCIPYGDVYPRELVRNIGGSLHLLLGWYPLWPGFALNTLFYAAIAWGLWQVPLAIRRRRRRRLNRCVKCGYDRAGLATTAACPECGLPGS